MGERISVGICVTQVGKGTHINGNMCFPGRGKHITGDMRSYSLERRFFVLEYSKGDFPGLKKSWKNGHFWTKTMG